MIPLIEEHRADIAALCEKFHVVRLEVFGSAAMGDFDEARSDVDFLVEFSPNHDLGPWLSTYFDLKEALEELLERDVDLVMGSAMKNPYFIGEANRTRKMVYAA